MRTPNGIICVLHAALSTQLSAARFARGIRVHGYSPSVTFMVHEWLPRQVQEAALRRHLGAILDESAGPPCQHAAYDVPTRARPS